MLIEEPAEQAMIAKMRKLRKRLSLRELGSRLDKDGIRTRAGTAFSAAQLHRILSRRPSQ
jgi:hypothetical protein